MKKKSLFALAVFAAGSMTMSAAAGQTVLAYWNFNSQDLPGGGFGFLADPDDFPLAADLGAGTLSVGGGILSDTVVNSNGDLVYQWVQSFAGTAINAQKGDPAGGTLSIQGGTDTANNGAYVDFAIDMTGLSDLTISYATRGTGSGFSSQTWSWSTDGVDFTDFETVVGTTVTSFFLVELATLNALDGEANAFLRLTFDGATGSTGNNRLDNIRFDATPDGGGSECPADLNGDGVVDFADLLVMLSVWGACEGCPEDLNGDGFVDFADLLELLSAWGDC